MLDADKVFALYDFSLVTDCPSGVPQKMQGVARSTQPSGLLKEDSQPDLAFFNLLVESAI